MEVLYTGGEIRKKGEVLSRINKPVFLFCAALCLVCISCGGKKSHTIEMPAEAPGAKDTIEIWEEEIASNTETTVKSETALRLAAHGLVDVQDIDPSIAVSLVYATANNFTGQVLYDNLREAYLHPEAAEALVAAQAFLQQEVPGYSLVVFDATRPLSIQRKMWDLVKNTPQYFYVSNPNRGGSLHNYGLAVDLSIIDAGGNLLPMGTSFDHFGTEAHTTDEAALVKQGLITSAEKEHRELLRRVMRKAGFRVLHSEWWHFHLHGRETAKEHYTIIE